MLFRGALNLFKIKNNFRIEGVQSSAELDDDVLLEDEEHLSEGTLFRVKITF